MKVKINRTVTTKEEVDVGFPIYREHDVSGDRDSTFIYTKIDANEVGKLTEQSITISGSSVSLEIDRNYRFDNSGSDYLLGKGLYQSSESEFREAALKSRSMVDEILSGVDQ